MRARRTVLTLMAAFLAIGLIEVRLPFLAPSVGTDLRTSIAVSLFWVIRAAAVPLIFAIDRLMARRFWLGIAADLALIEILGPLSSLVTWLLLGGGRRFPLSALTPFGAPLLVVIFIAVAAAAAMIRYRERLLEERVAEERTDEELARRALQVMQAEVHGETIVASLGAIESLIGANRKSAERAITAASDFLQLVMRRTGRDRVPLDLELRFIAAAIEVDGVIAGREVRCGVDGAVPDFECEPESLRPFMDEASSLAARGATRVQLGAAAEAGNVVARATSDAGRVLFPILAEAQ